MQQEHVSLANLRDGAAIERFDDELRNVIANILDPNTTIGKREIVLKVTIEPDANRNVGKVNITCSSKLAPAASLDTTFFLGRDASGPVASEYSTQQQVLPIEDVKSEGLRVVG